MNPITVFDMDILNFIQENLRTDVGDYFWQFITLFGDGGIFFLLLSIILIIFAKTRETGMRILIALMLCFIFGDLIMKNIFARLRPFYLVDNFNLLISTPSGYSFPSGHTEASFAVATVFFMMNRKGGIIAYIFASFVGFSRLYLFVHYPSDVLFGIIVGIICAAASCNIISEEKIKRLRGNANDNRQL